MSSGEGTNNRASDWLNEGQDVEMHGNVLMELAQRLEVAGDPANTIDANLIEPNAPNFPATTVSNKTGVIHKRRYV